ncbi:unnamed protein product, partial [Aureobasidium vineae]
SEKEDDSLIAQEEVDNQQLRTWKPISLRLPFLTFVLLTTSALIVVLQWLLYISQTTGGVLFASNINDLPLSKTFGYLYAPTIIAVIYGLLWSWIDLDIERMELYYQLCSPAGALAENSLLLQYPFDFVALIPFKAARRKHWSVLTAGLAGIVVLWTLTPLQAGIFVTENRVVTTEANEVWNGATKINPQTKYNSSSGCSYGLPVKTMARRDNDTSKNLEAMYVGYSNDNGEADWYLGSYCPKQANHTFLVRTTLFSEVSEAGMLDQSLESKTTPDSGVLKTTSLYCEPRYFEQEVNASVVAANGSVISVNPIGGKNDLPLQMFDINFFETAMSSGLDYCGPGMSYASGRADFPENAWPDQKTHLINTNLDMTYLPKMLPFSYAALKRLNLEDCLDPQTLADSYQAAYRLLFVAKMARVLRPDFGANATHHEGQRTYHTQALVLVPGFTYAVETLLVFAVLFNLSIIYFSLTRACTLQFDPTTIASHMSAAADHSELIALLGNLDNNSAGALRSALVGSKFSMSSDVKIELQSVPATDFGQDVNTQQTTHSKGFQSPSSAGVAVLCSWRFSSHAYLCLHICSTKQKSTMNYIPTAISTTLEPVWILLTRQLCVLQPFEELRRGKSTSRKSIALAYTNLPPQLVVFKALRTGHYMLSLLATMTILSNVLSVAFSSLFFEKSANIEIQTTLQPLLALPFQSLNGTDLPFNNNLEVNWQGGTTKDEFYIAMSNAVASSKLPSWTDPDRFYFPVQLPESTRADLNYTVTTGYFGASLSCEELTQWEAKKMEDNSGAILSGHSLFEFNITQPDGSSTNCSISFSTSSPAYISGFNSLEISTLAAPSDSCKQTLVTGWWRGNASNQTFELTSTKMLCHPKLVTRSAEVTVSSSGHILRSKVHFITKSSDLILQAHQFTIDKTDAYKSGWHNDSFPMD